MAFFGKKGGSNKPAKPKKEKKQKAPKQKKSGRRKQKSLIEMMGLNETVAAMGLDVLRTATEEQSAVRELDEGYTAVAITESDLTEAGVTVRDESFGAFADALRSEHIKSILLQNDLENGIIVIIPDESSLEIMDEFEFMADLAFQWVVVPFEIEDDSQVELLGNTTTLAELTDIAANERTLSIHNGDIIIDGELPDDADEEGNSYTFDDDESDLDEDLEDDGFDEDSFDDGDDVPDFDEDIDDFDDEQPDSVVSFDDDDDIPEVDEDEIPVYDDDDTDFSDDIEDDIDDSLFDDADDTDDAPVYDDVDDAVDEDLADISEEDARHEIQRVMKRSFYNDELGITVDESIFDLHFDNQDTELLLFDERPTDNSSLSVTLTQMRKDANVELMKQRAMHIQALRSRFNVVMADTHDQLAELLDYKNDKTKIGRKYADIRLNQDRMKDRADDLLTQKRQELDAAYNAKRDEVGKHAFNIAVEKYDELHRAQHDASKAVLQDEITAAIDSDADKEIAELYNDRRVLASRLFDKSTTKLLVDLQNIYKGMVETELQMYDKFRLRQDRYLRDNFSNEVLRGQAITEQQRQRAEGDVVRERYEALLAQKQSELEDAKNAANARVNELAANQESVLASTIAEYKAQQKRLEARNDALNQTINDLQNSLSDVDRRTKSEYQAQLSSKDDIIKGQKDQLLYAEERASKTTKANGGIIAAFVLVALAVGLIGGFVVGHMGSRSAQAATPTANQPSTIVVTPGGQTNVTPSDDSDSDASSDSDVVESESSVAESDVKSTNASTDNSTAQSSATESTQSSDK